MVNVNTLSITASGMCSTESAETHRTRSVHGSPSAPARLVHVVASENGCSARRLDERFESLAEACACCVVALGVRTAETTHRLDHHLEALSLLRPRTLERERHQPEMKVRHRGPSEVLLLGSLLRHRAADALTSRLVAAEMLYVPFMTGAGSTPRLEGRLRWPIRCNRWG